MSKTKMGNKKTWAEIGTLRKGDNGNYIKLADNVTILVDGEEVEMNKSRTVQLQDPRKKLDFLFDNGHIDEASYEKRKEKLSENQWLRYTLVVPPASKSE